NNPAQNSDDAATDILIDHNYLYAVGYTDNGEDYKNDVMMVSFLLENPVANVLSIKELRGNDTPTGAILVNIPPSNPKNRLAKSRATITGITDMPRSGNSQDFFTMMFDNDDLNNLLWLRYFRSPANGTDIPTSITKDKFDNVYVTGYSFVNNNNPFDFATIKYNNNGSFGWDGTGVRYFDYNSQSGDDKATSIKTHFDSVYIAGPCQNASNGFYIAKYAQISGIIINQWDRVFTPAFTNSMTPPLFQTAAKMEIDTLGNVYLISFSWNASESHFAIRKYDANGNELFTYDNSDNSGDSFTENNNLETDNFKIENNVNEFSLSQNYPNPFNPTTNLEFGISELGFVTIKIYDLAGKEVNSLVNKNLNPGKHKISFDASALPSGIYYYKITSGNYSDVKKMILLK
ncbi:MAG: T9SS type A sorting domain-containing protein, partial [Ignavibacteria bacterium]|nr:T9SS type A sorting domain-containing protein [Ignavibacteria bacterium]